MTHTHRSEIEIPFPVEKFKELQLKYLHADIDCWTAKETTLKAQYEEQLKEIMRTQCSVELELAAIEFLTPNGRYNGKRANQLAVEFEALGLVGLGPFQKWRFRAGSKGLEAAAKRDRPEQSPKQVSRPRRRPRQTDR